MEPPVIDMIKAITYFLPIAGLIWKAAQMSADVKNLRKDLDEAYKKACSNNQHTNEKMEQEQRATDSAIATIINQLSDIKVSLARLDERLSLQDEKKTKTKGVKA